MSHQSLFIIREEKREERRWRLDSTWYILTSWRPYVAPASVHHHFCPLSPRLSSSHHTPVYGDRLAIWAVQGSMPMITALILYAFPGIYTWEGESKGHPFCCTLLQPYLPSANIWKKGYVIWHLALGLSSLCVKSRCFLCLLAGGGLVGNNQTKVKKNELFSTCFCFMETH